jgi:hypothetical protein
MSQIQENENGIENKSDENKSDENKSNTIEIIDECSELKNIEYQTMLQMNSVIVPKKRNIKSLKNIDEMLEKEYNRGTKEIPWNKLDKIYKLEKLNSYADKLAIEHSLNKEEYKLLKQYLKQCLDRKQLQKTKDIVYDKLLGEIKSIPGLQIKDNNSSTNLNELSSSIDISNTLKRFTLKNIDKKNMMNTKTIKNSSSNNLKQKRQRVNKLKNKSKTNDKNITSISSNMTTNINEEV